MSEQVGSEAYSGFVRCELLHGSRHCRLRAGEEREPVPEAWEGLHSGVDLSYSCFAISPCCVNDWERIAFRGDRLSHSTSEVTR